jgi:putative transcriptional regulator
MATKLKIGRTKSDLKQYELAEKLGISRYYLSALERGKYKNPSIELMKKISKILEMPVQDLFF